MFKYTNLILIFSFFSMQISQAAPVSTYDLESLDVVIAKVTTLGLAGFAGRKEQTFYNAHLNYKKDSFWWVLDGYSSGPANRQGEAQAATWNAFDGSITVPLICDTATQNLCWSVRFHQLGFPGSGVYGNISYTPATATHPIGDWEGTATDTLCGGTVSNNIILTTKSNGRLTGTATDTEGESYVITGNQKSVITGNQKSSSMSFKAKGDDGGDITMNCDLDASTSSCIGDWTGKWIEYDLNCGGPFSLTRIQNIQ